MPNLEPLGIVSVDSIHYYVRDMERIQSFFTEQMDFLEIGHSSAEMERRGGQRSLVFEAGRVRVTASCPTEDGSRADRWLRKHPEGVGAIVFEVRDIDRTFALLESRGATLITDIERVPTSDGGRIDTFNITTPFGDTTFRFLQRRDSSDVFPGFVRHATRRGGANRFGFGEIDHITSNFQTMRPMLLWMEHVMGFDVYWDVEFHTVDVSENKEQGSGLKSVVVWDPESQVKFANNEPARPFFKRSQINLFGEDHRGDGVQHAALTVPDILSTVRGLGERKVGFMPTPGTYYDMLPERLRRIGVDRIDESIDTLRELGILVDGAEHHAYMLQIFLKEQAGLFEDPEAGPFFIEIIQRKGDKGFGAGNFRALFESIERQQQADGRI